MCIQIGNFCMRTQIVNLSICVSCMCDTKLVKVILIWKTKTIKIQAAQINRLVSKAKAPLIIFKVGSLYFMIHRV